MTLEFIPKLHVPLMRAAFDKGELQCQEPGFIPHAGCSYTGPCVVGAAFSQQVREWLQNGLPNYAGLDIDTLMDEGAINVPDGFGYLLSEAQGAHDAGELEHLDEVLTRMEAKINAE